MLTTDELARIRIVLVGARNPNNIGAAARAMQDFGLSRLYLVNDYKVALETAVSAIGASDILRTAIDAPTVADAVAGCSLVVGTTAVGDRGIEHRLLGLVEAAAEIAAALRRTNIDDDPAAEPHPSPANEPQVALLFGSEKTGLTNDALSHCDLLLTIPMHQPEGERHLSMNLGQSVAVCLWELARSARTVPEHLSAEPSRANAEETERVVELLREVMRETEYNRRFPATCDENSVRRFVHRMRLNSKDAHAWLGILRQMLWRLGRLDRKP